MNYHNWQTLFCIKDLSPEYLAWLKRLKPYISIGTWFHWYLAKSAQQTSLEAENGDEKIQENCYYFQYRLGETYGTSQKYIPFRNNVWQKEIYSHKIYTDFFTVASFLQILQRVENFNLRCSTLAYITLHGINLKGENFKFSWTRKWWKISTENWSWWCCMLHIGHLRMEKAKWFFCFAGLCRQQRVSFNFWWITKIEVLETFEQRIITALLS